MINIPDECCEMGSYGCSVPVYIDGKIEHVDACVAKIVQALNDAGIRTVASCCGHGIVEPSIILDDGISIVIGVYNHEKMQHDPVKCLREKLKDAGGE